MTTQGASDQEHTTGDRKHTGLKTRVLSGLVLAPLTVAVIVWGGWPFMILMGAALAISLYEWIGLARADRNPVPVMAIGVLYLGLCYASYIYLRFWFPQGAWLAIAVILSVWASDTGAYFVGKAVGGPKLAPQISPKKTWAGLGGAVFSSGLILVLLMFLSPYAGAHIAADMGLTPRDAFCVFVAGGLMGVAGQAGDLLISVFKRRVGKKDMGCLIPGHGGLLDRIDALLLVSPLFVVLVSLWLK